jgi:NADPH2:quinone reductase
MLEANALKHNIAKTYPLAEIVAAHETVEQGRAIGNVVLTM